MRSLKTFVLNKIGLFPNKSLMKTYQDLNDKALLLIGKDLHLSIDYTNIFFYTNHLIDSIKLLNYFLENSTRILKLIR